MIVIDPIVRGVSPILVGERRRMRPGIAVIMSMIVSVIVDHRGGDAAQRMHAAMGRSRMPSAHDDRQRRESGERAAEEGAVDRSDHRLCGLVPLRAISAHRG